jgi:hypothetical protein
LRLFGSDGEISRLDGLKTVYFKRCFITVVIMSNLGVVAFSFLLYFLSLSSKCYNVHIVLHQKSMRYRSMRLLLSRVRRVTRWLKE